MHTKFNKFIICVLTLVMIMQSVSAFAEVQTGDSNGTTTLLDALDISLENREYTENTEITRAEAAIILIKFMNLPVASTNESYYTDVTKDTYGNNEIMFATDLGLSNGYGDGIYRPEQKITYREALVMTARALGYGKIMEASGDAMSFIGKLKITQGISGLGYDDPVAYGVMQAILYNALSCDVAEQKIYTNKGQEYEYGNEDGKTALEKYFSVFRYSGVVTATEVTSLAGYDVTSKNRITIGNKEFKANSGSIAAYLGQSIDAYYKVEKNETVDTLLYVYNTRSEVKSFNDDDITDFSGTEYKVEGENDKREQTYRLAANYSLIYNGKLLNDHSNEEKLVPKNGSVTLVDTTKDGRYDVVFVSNYELALVSKIDTQIKKIYDKIYGKNFSYDAENVNVYDENGYAMEIGDIQNDSVALIAISEDGENVDIRVSAKVITGKIEGTNKDKVVIDGNKYELSSVFYDTEDANLNVGDTASFRLDPYGKIVCRITAETTEQSEYYFLLKATRTDDIYDRAIIKVLRSDDERKNFYVSKKVKIDKKGGYKNTDSIIAALQKTLDDGTIVTNRVPVKLKFNADNEVTEIDLPYENGEPKPGESDNSLHKYASYFNDPIAGLQNNDETNVLSGRIAYKPTETIVFVVPNENMDTAPEDDFRASIYNKQYTAFSFMKCDAYTDKYPELYADVLVSRDTGEIALPTEGGHYFVENIETVLDKDDIPREQFTLLEGKEVYTYFVADDADRDSWNVDIGDVIRIATNSKEELVDMAIYYDESTGTVDRNMYSITTATNIFHTGEQVVMGGVYDVNGGFLKVFSANITPDRNSEFFLAHINKFYGMMVYSKRTKTTEPFDLSKIATYKEAGADYTKAVIVWQVGQPRFAYFYVD